MVSTNFAKQFTKQGTFNSKPFWFCFTLLSSFISIGFNSANAGEFNHVINIGDPLPAFSNLPSVKGKTFSSNDFKEDILVLVSLSNNCPFSRGAEKDIVDLVNTFKDESVRVVGVSYNLHENDLMPAMKDRAKAKGFNFTYLRDDSQALGRALGTSVTPEFYIFDKERRLIYMGVMFDSPAMAQSEDKTVYMRGEITERYVDSAILRTLAGKDVSTTETKPYGCSVEYRRED
ncbi:redoxin domain-containing protein [Aurantivibrio infirmus]